MLIWFVIALMTAAATLAVILPLARARTADRNAAEQETAVYRDQLAEIDRDRERGLIGETEAEAARAEVARRLLKAESAAQGPRSGRSFARPAAVAMLVLVPALSLWTYTSIGSPDLPDQPLSARLAAPADPNDIAGMLARVEAHLANNPGDAEGWTVVAPIYMRLGRFADAADAYGRLVRLSGANPDLQEAYGEALVASDNGLVNEKALAAFDAVLAADPGRVKSRFYRAEGLSQSGRMEEALSEFDRIVADSPPGAPWMPLVGEKRTAVLAALGRPVPPAASGTAPAAPAATAPGPGAADIAAAADMSDEDRQAMIGGMVQRLADRLAAEPRDAAGWQRLIRAYGVMGRVEDAKAAYVKATSTFADDPAVLEALEAVAAEAGISG